MASPLSTERLAAALDKELAGSSDFAWTLEGLRGGAVPYSLWPILGARTQPVLIVTETPALAEKLASDLAVHAGESEAGAVSGRRIQCFPPREAPPLEMVSPTPEVEAARNAALHRLLAEGDAGAIVVTSPEAIAQRTIAHSVLVRSTIDLRVEADLDLDAFVERLGELGYRKGSNVDEAGEFAVRGGIIDLWPPGLEYPCRIELFGDMIESIRFFDPADQRSFDVTDEVVVLPSSPFSASELAETTVRRAVAERCDDLLLPTSESSGLDRLMVAGEHFPGMELLQPYVTDENSWLGAYLPDSTLLCVVDPKAVDLAIEHVAAALVEAESAATTAGTFFPEPSGLFVEPFEVRGLLARRPAVAIETVEAVESRAKEGGRVWRMVSKSNTAVTAARARVKTARGKDGFEPLADALRGLRADAERLVVTATDPTQAERLEHLLAGARLGSVVRCPDLPSALARKGEGVSLVVAGLTEGFSLPADSVAVVSDVELFGARRGRRRRHRGLSRAGVLGALSRLGEGDYVVHVDHGVGLYHGLKHLRAGGTEGDFLHLEYAGGDRYYLPVDRIGLVEKYVGASSSAPSLDKLGGTSWARAKKKARDSILEMARELLDIEAFRATYRRDVWARPGADFEEFEARFPFEETEGQLQSIQAVVADLVGPSPMDRVVCGDVGYGKTEVSMRAAYLAATAGKQVAFLVPTTVLARQHTDTLVERFEGYPVEIRMLSRFNTPTENAQVLEGLAAGTIDIVVGTHRLLQRDVRFASLGMLVIDEEHRFGVKAKEYIKRRRREVDVLTMTATPIPRTLQLSLTGVRDLSLIETPPMDRLAIRTYVARYDEGLIKQSIERELRRDGQVFFVHNRVGSIEVVARRIAELVPEARVVVAHGQMNEHELERVMVGFVSNEANVLVCTSIIESGLDVPNANTMIVNRADTFGLAQLYQIRGRVGRSSRRAYAYLLVPGEQIITADARKRLAVLQELDGLGGGFRLAAHDMEIRGAGNLLGKAQSGNIAAVGFELFMQMLEQASNELRGLPPKAYVEPEIELGAEAFLPDSYVEDIPERLMLYKRMANAGHRSELEMIGEELEDRFGEMPPPARAFLRIMGLRPALKLLGVDSLRAAGTKVTLRFDEHSALDADHLVALATTRAKKYRVRPGGRFTVSCESSGSIGPMASGVKDANGSADRDAGSDGDDAGWYAMVDEIQDLLDMLCSKLESTEVDIDAENDQRIVGG